MKRSEAPGPAFGAHPVLGRGIEAARGGLRRPAERPLRIGLLNNMPDAALVATERQFRRLLACPGAPRTELALFSLAGLPRGEAARAQMAARYLPHEALAEARLDALIVTGCEPRPGPMAEEPWFSDFGRIVDWARAETRSVLFSCLAAHAAVLHLDGLARIPRARKAWGVFAIRRTGRHPLLAGTPRLAKVPHSRWNGLERRALTEAGYQILRDHDEIGPDLFVREMGSLLVFLQGHPEYDPDTLAKEYRRDVLRFLSGERADAPPLPVDYFDAVSRRLLAETTAEAIRHRDPARLPAWPRLSGEARGVAAWQSASRTLFANWLDEILLRRGARLRREAPAPARETASAFGA